MSKKGLIFFGNFFVLFFFLFPNPVFANLAIFPEDARISMIHHSTYIAFMFFLNLCFELGFLYALGLRKRRYLLSIIAANTISWPIFTYLIYAGYEVLPLELLVILFEIIFIFLLSRDVKLWKLLLLIPLANIVTLLISTQEILTVDLYNQIRSLLINTLL